MEQERRLIIVDGLAISEQKRRKLPVSSRVKREKKEKKGKKKKE